MADSFIKDPDSVETFSVVWCSKSNVNTGGAADNGELQGETISTAAAVMPDGLTLDSESKTGVTIQGVAYSDDTIHNMTMSGGTAGANYSVVSRITTSGGRTLDKTIRIVCREE
jgi:hypothetical protein